MDQNVALSPADLDAGYVLTCQSHPTSPTLTIDYDMQGLDRLASLRTGP